jgi:hypothetical protein
MLLDLLDYFQQFSRAAVVSPKRSRIPVNGLLVFYFFNMARRCGKVKYRTKLN